MDAASQALIVLRRVKSEAKVSPRTPFLAVELAAPAPVVPLLEEIAPDVAAATKAEGRPTFVADDAVSEADDAAAIRVLSFELGEAPAKKKPQA